MTTPNKEDKELQELLTMMVKTFRENGIVVTNNTSDMVRTSLVKVARQVQSREAKLLANKQDVNREIRKAFEAERKRYE